MMVKKDLGRYCSTPVGGTERVTNANAKKKTFVLLQKISLALMLKHRSRGVRLEDVASSGGFIYLSLAVATGRDSSWES